MWLFNLLHLNLLAFYSHLSTYLPCAIHTYHEPLTHDFANISNPQYTFIGLCLYYPLSQGSHLLSSHLPDILLLRPFSNVPPLLGSLPWWSQHQVLHSQSCAILHTYYTLSEHVAEYANYSCACLPC